MFLAGKALVGVDFTGLRLARGQRIAAELGLLLDRDAVRPLDRLAGVDRDHAASSFRSGMEQGSGRSKPCRMRASCALSSPGGTASAAADTIVFKRNAAPFPYSGGAAGKTRGRMAEAPAGILLQRGLPAGSP